MSGTDLLLIILSIVIAGFFLLYFVLSKLSGISSEKGDISTSYSSKGTEYEVEKEMQELGLPPDRIQAAVKKISRSVDQQIHKQTEQVKLEMKTSYDKIVTEKETEVKQIKTEYETVQKENKKTQKEKKQTETVVRSMAKGLVVLSDEGEVLFVNPVAEKILGVKPQTLIGKTLDQTQGGDAFISLVNEEGEEQKRLASAKKNSETQEIIKESTAVIEGDSGQTKGMISILTGMTQKKKVDDFKNEFLSNVTHELRTPIICIQKSMEAMKEEMKDIPPDQKNYLDIAVRNSKRLEMLVNDILDVTKLEAGKMVLRKDLFSIQQFVQDAKKTFSLWARDKKIELTAVAPEEPIAVEADQQRLSQVIMNLVSNALKFTPHEGKVAIEAQVIKDVLPGETKATDFMQVGVRDTGPGISKENQEKLFQKFADVGTRASGGEKGTGLGLTIAKEIVELHSGRIWVESELGKGTFFAFAVPVRPPEKTAEATEAPPETAA